MSVPNKVVSFRRMEDGTREDYELLESQEKAKTAMRAMSKYVPVDLVRQDAAILLVRSNAYQITYEGRLHRDTGEITGTFTQGPYELPLNLHREP